MCNRLYHIFILCFSIILLFGCNNQKEELRETRVSSVENNMTEAIQDEDYSKDFVIEKKMN